jgi:hypothetical protein
VDPAQFESYTRVNPHRRHWWQRKHPAIIYAFPNRTCFEEFQNHGPEAALRHGAVIQAYRYPKEQWQEYEALRHCLKLDGKFEPALVM